VNPDTRDKQSNKPAAEENGDTSRGRKKEEERRRNSNSQKQRQRQ
jgi:hypothetical protein